MLSSVSLCWTTDKLAGNGGYVWGDVWQIPACNKVLVSQKDTPSASWTMDVCLIFFIIVLLLATPANGGNNNKKIDEREYTFWD